MKLRGLLASALLGAAATACGGSPTASPATESPTELRDLRPAAAGAQSAPDTLGRSGGIMGSSH